MWMNLSLILSHSLFFRYPEIRFLQGLLNEYVDICVCDNWRMASVLSGSRPRCEAMMIAIPFLFDATTWICNYNWRMHTILVFAEVASCLWLASERCQVTGHDVKLWWLRFLFYLMLRHGYVITNEKWIMREFVEVASCSCIARWTPIPTSVGKTSGLLFNSHFSQPTPIFTNGCESADYICRLFCQLPWIIYS